MQPVATKRSGDPSDAIVAQIKRLAGSAKRVVFVSGNFNVIHPGHLRLLRFAADCGDLLVVGVNGDGAKSAVVPAELRLEGVRAISLVDYAFMLEGPAPDFVGKLTPHVVVKGKEFEDSANPEQPIVESYGGKLMFGSGETRFSSLDLLQRELLEADFSAIRKPTDYLKRHGFAFRDLERAVHKFAGLQVVVIGDLIVDEYISCDPLGMSREDPTLVVTPIKEDRFVGGAGIVAAHARGLGADVSYFGVVGRDSVAAFADETLARYGVETHFVVDESRPTTLKQRYRASGKTLLRVSRLRQHAVSRELSDQLFEMASDALRHCDLLLFSDFNYGCLPQPLVDRLSANGAERGVMMAADSQASSQIGDISRFKGMQLITPTEHEARLAVRDFSSGLVVLTEQLRTRAQADHVLVTLSGEGLFIHAPNGPSDAVVTDQLAAFNMAPKDVSGAGDSLFTCSSMALAVGAGIWQSAYLGSLAAACQVGRVGNHPVSAADLVRELQL
jgi:rfaE bifunctional protein kinase chain/domain